MATKGLFYDKLPEEPNISETDLVSTIMSRTGLSAENVEDLSVQRPDDFFKAADSVIEKTKADVADGKVDSANISWVDNHGTYTLSIKKLEDCTARENAVSNDDKVNYFLTDGAGNRVQIDPQKGFKSITNVEENMVISSEMSEFIRDGNVKEIDLIRTIAEKEGISEADAYAMQKNDPEKFRKLTDEVKSEARELSVADNGIDIVRIYYQDDEGLKHFDVKNNKVSSQEEMAFNDGDSKANYIYTDAKGQSVQVHSSTSIADKIVGGIKTVGRYSVKAAGKVFSETRNIIRDAISQGVR